MRKAHCIYLYTDHPQHLTPMLSTVLVLSSRQSGSHPLGHEQLTSEDVLCCPTSEHWVLWAIGSGPHKSRAKKSPDLWGIRLVSWFAGWANALDLVSPAIPECPPREVAAVWECCDVSIASRFSSNYSEYNTIKAEGLTSQMFFISYLLLFRRLRNKDFCGQFFFSQIFGRFSFQINPYIEIAQRKWSRLLTKCGGPVYRMCKQLMT